MLLIHVSEGQALVWAVPAPAPAQGPTPAPAQLPGRPVGSLARQPRQNLRLGLPLALLPEEARLLAELGRARLVRAPGPASGAEGEGEGERLRCSHAQQRQLALRHRRSQLEALDPHIRQGRDSKRRGRAHPDVQEPRPEQEEEVGCPAPAPAPLTELSALEEEFTFPLESCLLQLDTACPRPRTLQLLDWRAPSPDWPYPGIPSHRLRYAVFRDLRARGYHLTAGGKFGGDFLVYPGDPVRFHAHYIALCVPHGRPLPLRETVTAGRLGSNVKKTVLLCSEAEGGGVVYTSLRWSGIQ